MSILGHNIFMASDQALQFSTLIKARQNEICDALSAIDDATFQVDDWTRPGGGGGNTRILSSDTFEKAGVNTSQVYGHISKKETPMFSTLIKN